VRRQSPGENVDWRRDGPVKAGGRSAGQMLTGRLIMVRSFLEPEGGGKRAFAIRGRDCGVCVSFGDEGKFGLATRPAKLYSTSSALLRLMGLIGAGFDQFGNKNSAVVSHLLLSRKFRTSVQSYPMTHSSLQPQKLIPKFE